jgi:hypothetical protein
MDECEPTYYLLVYFFEGTYYLLVATLINIISCQQWNHMFMFIFLYIL